MRLVDVLGGGVVAAAAGPWASMCWATLSSVIWTVIVSPACRSARCAGWSLRVTVTLFACRLIGVAWPATSIVRGVTGLIADRTLPVRVESWGKAWLPCG